MIMVIGPHRKKSEAKSERAAERAAEPRPVPRQRHSGPANGSAPAGSAPVDSAPAAEPVDQSA